MKTDTLIEIDYAVGTIEVDTGADELDIELVAESTLEIEVDPGGGRGPQGPQGLQGPQGPQGPAGDGSDIPDLVLIFENQLI